MICQPIRLLSSAEVPHNIDQSKYSKQLTLGADSWHKLFMKETLALELKIKKSRSPMDTLTVNMFMNFKIAGYDPTVSGLHMLPYLL